MVLAAGVGGWRISVFVSLVMSVVQSVVLARKQTQPRVVLSVARLLASCRVALITAPMTALITADLELISS